jgi:hypothetical protein
MDARRIVIVGRFGRRLLFWCALGATLALGPGAGSAQTKLDACSQSFLKPSDNDCQNQVQDQISYNVLESKTWAYYCKGDHPYFAAANSGVDFGSEINNNKVVGVANKNPQCFSSIENTLFESNNGAKMDGVFTNWCVSSKSLVVALACSDTPQ